MKISLNQELSVLTEARDRGELSATEYRLQRRNILEQLSSASVPPQAGAKNTMFKSIVTGTVIIVSLLLVTVFLVKAFM